MGDRGKNGFSSDVSGCMILSEKVMRHHGGYQRVLTTRTEWIESEC
jgi:hypothetical protein